MEIWKWKEREGAERLGERYLRWVLGVESRTPGYMVREELQRKKLKERTGRRAWGEKVGEREGGRKVLARRCLEEMKQRSRLGIIESKWKEERKTYYEERKIKIKEVKEIKEKRERGRLGENFM